MKIILASSSEHRKKQLEQLGLKFTCNSPDVDESQLADENPKDLAMRLAIAKADKIYSQHPNDCVIGSDQVGVFQGQVFGKPGDKIHAIKQLQAFSNEDVEFYTALCVIDNNGNQHTHTDLTTVKFRQLSVDEIERYIAKEQPFNCAGSFKVESMGSSLFSAVVTSDPSALIGLPLIKLSDFLRSCGHKIP